MLFRSPLASNGSEVMLVVSSAAVMASFQSEIDCSFASSPPPSEPGQLRLAAPLPHHAPCAVYTGRLEQLIVHESFAVSCPLALIGTAFYAALVHRHTGSLHASSPHPITLLQSCFASFVVINLRPDFHRQECADAGAHEKPGRSRVCRRPQGQVRPPFAPVRPSSSAAPPAPASAP